MCDQGDLKVKTTGRKVKPDLSPSPGETPAQVVETKVPLCLLKRKPREAFGTSSFFFCCQQVLALSRPHKSCCYSLVSQVARLSALPRPALGPAGLLKMEGHFLTHPPCRELRTHLGMQGHRPYTQHTCGPSLIHTRSHTHT